MSAHVQTVPYTFDPATHRTDVEGEQVLSVTQIIEAAGLTDFSMVAPEVLQRKQLLGTLVHQACHYWDMDDCPEALPAEVAERLESYKGFRGSTGYSPICHETRWVVIIDMSPGSGLIPGVTRMQYPMRYSMQFDSFGYTRNVPWIVDIKNSAQKSATFGVQLAAYELALPRPAPYVRYTRVAAWLLPKMKFRALTFSDPSDYDVWRAAYQAVVRPEWATPTMVQGSLELLARWKANKGIGCVA